MLAPAAGLGAWRCRWSSTWVAHVSAVCSSDAQLVRELGADELIDYKKEDFTERSELWDVILDTTEIVLMKSAITRRNHLATSATGGSPIR